MNDADGTDDDCKADNRHDDKKKEIYSSGNNKTALKKRDI